MPNCIICNHSEQKIAITFPEYSVLECVKCKFGIVDPIPSQIKLDELYNSKEYYDANMFYNFDTITKEEINRQIEKNYKLHFNYIGNYLKPKQKFLEIGSGGGFALKAFEKMGLDVLGVETSDVAQDFATKRLGLKVINSSIEDFKSNEKFDIILLNHVLEHFQDPVKAMEKLSSLLNQNGILYIRVPDHDSYDRKTYGKKWPAYAHYHISNFSAISLSLLYKKNGLEVLAIKKYLSEKITSKLIRGLIIRGPLKSLFINVFNGRTVTIIGRKK